MKNGTTPASKKSAGSPPARLTRRFHPGPARRVRRRAGPPPIGYHQGGKKSNCSPSPRRLHSTVQNAQGKPHSFVQSYKSHSTVQIFLDSWHSTVLRWQRQQGTAPSDRHLENRIPARQEHGPGEARDDMSGPRGSKYSRTTGADTLEPPHRKKRRHPMRQ